MASSMWHMYTIITKTSPQGQIETVPVGDNDRIAIDVIGEFPETENGNKYIIIISE